MFNVLLQILDDGRLTDGKGRVVNFKNTVIIMTSNLQRELLKDNFRPEFLNRIDDVIVFDSLGKFQMREIAKLLLKKLNERLEKQANIKFQWTDDAVKEIAEEGYDPEFGARPLKRLLSRTVETALSKKLIRGDVESGDIVTLDFKDGEFIFNDTKTA